MAGLQDLLEAYKNYRGAQEWKLGRQMDIMHPQAEQAMNLFGGFDTGGLVGMIKGYHGGANIPTNQLRPLTFFAEDPNIAKGYLEKGTQAGIGKLHQANLNINMPAVDQDVIEAAKRLGIYNPHENAQQYLTPEVYGDKAYEMMKELRRIGFDGAYLDDMSMEGKPFKSWVPFSSHQIR